MNRYRFQCDLCSGPDWTGNDLQNVPDCPKCGRSPVRYFDGDTAYCCLHGDAMTDHYTIPCEAILIRYSWSGHQSAFPNAKLFAASAEGETPRGKDSLTLEFCQKCEVDFRRWREDHV